MTDKIIVDGIDVSECEYYCEEYCNLSNDRNERLPFAEKCTNYSDCCYKQLKRKEQEYDALRSQLDFEVQQKECLEQECEELKKQLEQQEVLTETYKACYKAKHNDAKDELIKCKQALDKIAKEVIELFLGVENKDRPYCERILDIINKIKR